MKSARQALVAVATLASLTFILLAIWHCREVVSSRNQHKRIALATDPHSMARLATDDTLTVDIREEVSAILKLAAEKDDNRAMTIREEALVAARNYIYLASLETAALMVVAIFFAGVAIFSAKKREQQPEIKAELEAEPEPEPELEAEPEPEPAQEILPFPQMLFGILQEQGWSRRRLATEMKTNHTAVIRAVNGEVEPNEKMLLYLAQHRYIPWEARLPRVAKKLYRVPKGMGFETEDNQG